MAWTEPSKQANLSAFRMFVRFVLVWICRFPLPLGIWEGQRFVIVALPGLFSYLFFFFSILTLTINILRIGTDRRMQIWSTLTLIINTLRIKTDRPGGTGSALTYISNILRILGQTNMSKQCLHWDSLLIPYMWQTDPSIHGLQWHLNTLSFGRDRPEQTGSTLTLIINTLSIGTDRPE